MFNIGQRVVCVKTLDSEDALRLSSRPVRNWIYTVRGDILAYGAQYLYFDEIRNPLGNWTEIGFAEPPFWCGMFRPIVERKTDISIFTALLNPTPQKVRESIGYDLGFTVEEIGLS